MPAMWPIYRTDEALAAVEQAVAKGLTYAGAQRDVQKAKRLAEKNPRVVPTFLKQVERKQALLPAMERGEREDPQLAAIDAAVGDGLSYAGWQNDVKKAERFALETPALVGRFVEELRRKKALLPAMARGDRSDPLLASVDAAIATPLSYPAWQRDVAQAERYAVAGDERLVALALSEIQRKQMLLTDGGWSEETQLTAINAATAGLSYGGRRPGRSLAVDIERAERLAKTAPALVPLVLGQMQRAQRAHEAASEKGVTFGVQETRVLHKDGTIEPDKAKKPKQPRKKSSKKKPKQKQKPAEAQLRGDLQSVVVAADEGEGYDSAAAWFMNGEQVDLPGTVMDRSPAVTPVDGSDGTWR